MLAQQRQVYESSKENDRQHIACEQFRLPSHSYTHLKDSTCFLDSSVFTIEQLARGSAHSVIVRLLITAEVDFASVLSASSKVFRVELGGEPTRRSKGILPKILSSSTPCFF